eukprot:535785-Pelagomonas_calceolata.AAC.7
MKDLIPRGLNGSKGQEAGASKTLDNFASSYQYLHCPHPNYPFALIPISPLSRRHLIPIPPSCTCAPRHTLSTVAVGGSEELAAARERAFAGEDAAQRANAEAAQLRAKLTHLEQYAQEITRMGARMSLHG